MAAVVMAGPVDTGDCLGGAEVDAPQSRSTVMAYKRTASFIHELVKEDGLL